MSRLAAIVLTYNEQSHIVDCLRSLEFTDLQIVFDSFSTDDTVLLARQCGAEVVQQPFVNYADQRNAALETVSGRADWVLFVDADERVTPELAAAVRSALSHGAAYAGWRIARHNFIFGKLTRGAGWFPDYQTRLLRVGAAHYDPERKVHEVVILEGPLGTIDSPIVHYNYRDFAQFAAKQRRYTAYEAKILFEQGIRPRFRNFILQPIRHFRWRYLELGGWRDGLHGLRLSTLMAYYEYRKYRALATLWRNASA